MFREQIVPKKKHQILENDLISSKFVNAKEKKARLIKY